MFSLNLFTFNLSWVVIGLFELRINKKIHIALRTSLLYQGLRAF
jgi:hypothetical protein